MKLAVEARAKINIGLDVLRRRSDGYHEVRMIMESLSLSDTVTLEDKVPTAGSASEPNAPMISLTSDDPSMPSGPSNLAVKAALLLAEKAGKPLPLSIHIEKRIPMAAGLAGGSADAAAVLTGMNELYSLGFSKEELMAAGKKIGADVPYCIFRGSALSEGIGEKLSYAPDLSRIPVILAKPTDSISTKEIFEALVLDETTIHPDIDGMLEAMQKKDLNALGRLRGNLLETITIPRFPVIHSLITAFQKAGSPCTGMSGSGPTVFALFPTPSSAKESLASLQSSFPSVKFINTEIV